MLGMQATRPPSLSALFIKMRVEDYYTQRRRGWVRLHEKGGKEHDVPCHHTLEKYLDEYIAAAGIAGEPDGPVPHHGAARPVWRGRYTSRMSIA